MVGDIKPTQMIKKNDKEIFTSDDVEKASAFCQYFASVFTNDNVNTIQDHGSLHTNAYSSCLLSDLDFDEYEIV